MICSKCLEEYKFTDVHYEQAQKKYILYFSCLCPEPLSVQESELENMGLALSDDEQDYIREKKIGEIKTKLIEEKKKAV